MLVLSAVRMGVDEVAVPVLVLPRRRALRAQPVDREVAEARHVPEVRLQRRPHAVERGRIDRRHPPTAVAAQVLLVGAARERVEAGPVPDVDVADHAERLEALGLRVLVPERLPPNDGGVSYGQAAVAAARR